MMRFLEDVWSVERSEQREGTVLETLYDDIAVSNWCSKDFFYTAVLHDSRPRGLLLVLDSRRREVGPGKWYAIGEVSGR